MKEGPCIKCGFKDHIKKECTSGWKPAAEGLGKDKGKGKVDNKKVAVVQAADALISLVVALISFGRIISEDELDYEYDYGRGLSCTSGQTVSQDWFNISVVKKSISVSDWKYCSRICGCEDSMYTNVNTNVSISGIALNQRSVQQASVDIRASSAYV